MLMQVECSDMNERANKEVRVWNSDSVEEWTIKHKYHNDYHHIVTLWQKERKNETWATREWMKERMKKNAMQC